MSKGCKFDLALISMLVERWRPETNTFHLPCSECTITLKDVMLQLGLPVDGLVIMGSVVVPGKVSLSIAAGEGLEQVRRWLDIDKLVEG
ncbi:hypothetical protein PVK06_019303 [Gossypium arboreum]|uniref:Aminotransferase-like plant mobile domain-containing protein n=1 Tax=Gossypium arboreum TaxID=29729 RepID=A0ABR0PJA7_GOSAR|nr:hypothetical protein PVK06_019303 [Gossypium arboreum]